MALDNLLYNGLTNQLTKTEMDDLATKVNTLISRYNIPIAGTGRLSGKKMVVSGDSLSDSVQITYVQEMFDILGVSGNSVNGAMSGSATDRAIDMMTTYDRGTGYNPSWDLDYSTVDVVMFLLGANRGATGSMLDIPTVGPTGGIIDQTYFELFGNNFYGDMGFLIEYVLDENPNIEIYLVSPPNNNRIGYDPVSEIITALQELSTFYCVPFINLTELCTISQKYLDKYTLDGIHPNPLGASIIAKKLATHIEYH